MPDGTVIVGDYWNHRVMHYDTSGQPIGSGTSSCPVAGCLFSLASGPTVYSTPYGLAVDPTSDAVYVGFECCAVEKFTPNSKGVYVRQSTRIQHGFKYPSRVAVDHNAVLYVADMQLDKIFRFTSSGSYLGSWGSLGSGVMQFNQPAGIALDDASPQNLYIADAGNKRVDVINTSTAAFSSFTAPSGVTFGPNLRGLAIDATNDYVYVVDDSTGTVHQFTLAGAYLQDIGGPWNDPNGLVACCAPGGLFANGGREATVDGQGQLWVGDMPDYRAQVFSATGAFLFDVAGTPTAPPAGAFNGPHGVALDPSGNIITADTYNFRMQKFDSSFNVLWAKGMRGDVTKAYGFNYPWAVATEADSSILVVDSYNNAVRKYDSDGNPVWTYTGHLAVQKLNSPQGIFVGTGGTLYVADYLKKRVVELTDAGASVSYAGQIACTCFRQPSGVAVDPNTGDIFVSDYKAGDVVEFSSGGAQIATIGAGATPALQNPGDVVLDGTYLYVSDSKSDVVDVYLEADGSFVTSFGAPGSASNQLSIPVGLALNSNATEMYVADSGNDRVSVWCLVGTC